MKHLMTAVWIVWASPCSAVGLLFGLLVLTAGGSARRIGRTIEFAACRDADAARSGRTSCLPFSAITFGHTIIGTSHRELTRVRSHEQVHVRQYEIWGPLFFLAYPAASLWAWLRGRRPYRDNRFEIAARVVK